MAFTFTSCGNDDDSSTPNLTSDDLIVGTNISTTINGDAIVRDCMYENKPDIFVGNAGNFTHYNNNSCIEEINVGTWAVQAGSNLVYYPLNMPTVNGLVTAKLGRDNDSIIVKINNDGNKTLHTYTRD